MIRIVSSFALLLVATIVAVGCGGGTPDIDEVRSCLKELDLNVEDPPKGETDVKEGVFATTDLAGVLGGDGKADDAQFTFALAAIVTNDKAKDTFTKESRQFADTVDQEGKLEFKSGTSGDYVWVAGGESGSDALSDVEGCVKP